MVLGLLRRHSVEGAVNRIPEYHGPGLAGPTAMDRHVIADTGADPGTTTSVFPPMPRRAVSCAPRTAKPTSVSSPPSRTPSTTSQTRSTSPRSNPSSPAPPRPATSCRCARSRLNPSVRPTPLHAQTRVSSFACRRPLLPAARAGRCRPAPARVPTSPPACHRPFTRTAAAATCVSRAACSPLLGPVRGTRQRMSLVEPPTRPIHDLVERDRYRFRRHRRGLPVLKPTAGLSARHDAMGTSTLSTTGPTCAYRGRARR